MAPSPPNGNPNSSLKSTLQYGMEIDVDELASCPASAGGGGAFERDMAAKTKAKSPHGGKAVDRSCLDDMQAKERAKAPASTKVFPGAQAVRGHANAVRGSLENLDRDIEAKSSARRSLVSAGTPTKAVAKPSAFSSNNIDANAKNRAHGSGPAMIPGAFSAKDGDFSPTSDDDTAAKNRARMNGPATTPGAWNASREDVHHKDIVLGGSECESTRKISSEAFEGDVLAKQNAASPRFITFDDDIDDKKVQKKIDATYAGVGADPTKRGDQDRAKKDGPSASATQVAAHEAAFINHKLGTTFPNDGTHGIGQMELSVDDVEFLNVEDNKLAIATAVTEEEEDEFIPAAVEYDPDAKPPLYKNRRFRFYGCLAFFLMIVAVTAIVIPTQMAQDENLAPTAAPTTYRESLGIQEQIEEYIGADKLYDVNSTYNKALDWLLYDDPMQLPPDAQNLVQRYILALFYFQTSQQGPWRSCNPPKVNETSACEYKKIAGISPLAFEDVPWGRWLSDLHECDWAGISCDENKTTMIDLKGQELTGSLPTELSNLAYLRFIQFGYNAFSGTISSTFVSTMKYLTNFELQGNAFTGTVPPALFYFKNLIRVNLGTNMFTGTLSIPSDADFGNIKGLFLYDNQLTGTIPTALFQFTTLEFSRFSKNLFTGPLPSEIGLVTSLKEFWAHKTSISSTIPSDIGKTGKLKDLRLFDTEMTGKIPEELYSLTALGRLDLYDANFSGTISTRIGELSSLNVLRLRGNNFEGTIPSELNLLTQLHQVWLEHNDLSGTVPEVWCELRADDVLWDLSADCLNSSNTSGALVDCPSGCCTQCCDGKTKDCIDLVDIGN